MTKNMAIWFAFSMICMFLFVPLTIHFGIEDAEKSHHHIVVIGANSSAKTIIFGILAILSFLSLISNILSMTLGQIILNALIRRQGIPMQGIVKHATPAGYVNWVPNWELELELDDGRRARMQVARRVSFFPNEVLSVIAGNGNPARAVLPLEAVSRPSF